MDPGATMTAAPPTIRPLPEVQESLLNQTNLRAPGTTNWYAWLVVAVVCFGIALRIAALCSDRCLWIDEAMLALNILERSPARLLEPLDRNQGAPIGFLLAVKAATELFGPQEWALRLVPCLGSIVGLLVFVQIAYRLLPRAAARLAIALLAFSPYLVSYSGECKQYSTDATIAILLLALSLPMLEPKPRWGNSLALAIGGILAVWCSHASVFVLGGMGSVMLVQAYLESDNKKLLRIVLVIATWLASFAGCYFLTLQSLDKNNYLQKYWSEHFFPIVPRRASDITWLISHAFDFFSYPGGFCGRGVKLPGLAALLALAGGCVMMVQRGARPAAWFLIMPAILAIVASALKKYPFGGRMLLFLVPFALLFVAVGAMWLYEHVQGRGRILGILVMALLLSANADDSIAELQNPKRAEELRPVLVWVEARWEAGDRLYVYNGSGDSGAGPAFAFYGRQFPFPPEAVILGDIHREQPAKYLAEVRELQKRPGRVWVVFSHRHRDEETRICAYFESQCTSGASISLPGSAAYCFTFPQQIQTLAVQSR